LRPSISRVANPVTCATWRVATSMTSTAAVLPAGAHTVLVRGLNTM
jgi:hypothetical protein